MFDIILYIFEKRYNNFFVNYFSFQSPKRIRVEKPKTNNERMKKERMKENIILKRLNELKARKYKEEKIDKEKEEMNEKNQQNNTAKTF